MGERLFLRFHCIHCLFISIHAPMRGATTAAFVLAFLCGMEMRLPVRPDDFPVLYRAKWGSVCADLSVFPSNGNRDNFPLVPPDAENLIPSAPIGAPIRFSSLIDSPRRERDSGETLLCHGFLQAPILERCSSLRHMRPPLLIVLFIVDTPFPASLSV